MNYYPMLPTILVVTEGHTERIYLDHLRERDMGCSVIVRKSPRTGQDKVVKHCIQLIKDMGLNLKKGDEAYCVFDWDMAEDDLLKGAVKTAESKGIKVLFSKPCFEIVFLAHFKLDFDNYGKIRWGIYRLRFRSVHCHPRSQLC